MLGDATAQAMVEAIAPSAHRVEGRSDRPYLALARLLVGLLLRGGGGRLFGRGWRLGSGARDTVRGRAAGVGLDPFSLGVEARVCHLPRPLLRDDDIDPVQRLGCAL